MGLMMDNITSKEGHIDVDLELGGVCTNNNIINNNNNYNNDLDLSGGEGIGNYRMKQMNSESYDDNKENVKLVVVERKGVEEEVLEKKVVKERPKVMSAKKPPKPPRPPRGLSLDSADLKLIRELNELAKLKRARIERMKAVKKAREAKVGSSKNQWFATLLTVLFCLVVLFQGISSKTSSASSFQGSPISSGVYQNSIISVQHNPISSANYVNGPAGTESPRLGDVDGGGGKQSREG